MTRFGRHALLFWDIISEIYLVIIMRYWRKRKNKVDEIELELKWFELPLAFVLVIASLIYFKANPLDFLDWVMRQIH